MSSMSHPTKQIVIFSMADGKAEKEFETYRTREMQQLESDFDKAIKTIAKSEGNT